MVRKDDLDMFFGKISLNWTNGAYNRSDFILNPHFSTTEVYIRKYNYIIKKLFELKLRKIELRKIESSKNRHIENSNRLENRTIDKLKKIDERL